MMRNILVGTLILLLISISVSLFAYPVKTIVFDNGDRYEGEFSNDTMNGIGAYFYASGEIFIGEWYDGVMNGYGIDVSKDCRTLVVVNRMNGSKEGYGEVYYVKSDSVFVETGIWKNNEFVEKRSSFSLLNRYFKNNIKLKNKSSYSCTELDDYLYKLVEVESEEGNNRVGIYVFKGRYFFMGVDSRKTSRSLGTAIYDNGDRYAGAASIFREEEGRGIKVYKDGDIYIGDWEKGKISGKVILKYSDGDLYEGACLKNLAHGYGVLRSADGDIYEGDWISNFKYGFGIMRFKDGSKYIGNWERGFMNGYGVMYWNDGEWYEGNWVNDKRDGKGVFHYKDGKVKKGVWKDDEFVK